MTIPVLIPFAKLDTEDQADVKLYLLYCTMRRQASILASKKTNWLVSLLQAYMDGAIAVDRAPDDDPYVGKREVLYLPPKGVIDRGVNKGRR